ncbi:hypothetical protein BJV78DRAFT_1280344 [Lactifluus subvellereus]|nr:hypothetical protein BJV78DRAFT_1280344 [Lactifluus subvellereus]
MAKNKNKGFDLAKRQEKILKKMAKPLYKKADDSVYFVITQPFGMQPSPAARGTVDIDRFSSWISWVFGKQSVVEVVYTMSTRDEVIVKISEGMDSALILGKHKYNNILNAGWPRDPSLASCVFEYNYQSNGDPADHSWREHIASDACAPLGHFRNPYPVPTWAVRPSYIASLTRPLPESLPRTPERSPEPPSKAPSRTQGEDVKRDPSHSLRELDETDKTTAPFSTSVLGPVKAEPPSQADSSIKSEEPAAAAAAYEPSQALRDEIARLDAGRRQATIRVKQEPVSHQIKHEPSGVESAPSFGGNYDAQRTTVGCFDARSLGVKHEPRDDQSVASAAGPSQALQYEWSRYQSQLQRPGDPATGSPPLPHPSVAVTKQEPYILPPTARPPTVAQSSRTPESFDFRPLPSSKKIKREQTADEDEQPWKRPKTELN